jgi:predicted transcriptional regulator
MENKIHKLNKDNFADKDKITIADSDMNEFVKLASQVGQNTSKIENLEKKSEDLDGLKMEIVEIKTKQDGIEKQLKKLDSNDTKIEVGISKFRYWLVGGFVGFCLLVCSAIWTSLNFGLKEYSKDKVELKSSLTKQIEKVDSDSKDRHVIVDQKLDKIMIHLMKSE